MIRDEKLDFWLKENLNVILVGKHGVGKTHMVIDAFKRAGVKWLYFSASTMDPWVDFIGVPKEQKDENGNSYLELVRPRAFQNDEIEALFFDEFNRSHKKIRNAVLELIQFKSINGKKFNNLRVVWAAINPDEEDEEIKYDVEKLDPSQLDRFHVKVDVPYKPSYEYFKRKYSDTIAGAAVQWWNELDKKVKDEVSPRRLDYALDVYTKNGDLRDVLPSSCNISKLIHEIGHGPISKNLKAVFASKDVQKATEFISNENNFHGSIEVIAKNEEMIKFFVPIMPQEKIGSVIASSGKIREFVLGKPAEFRQVLEQVASANINKSLSKKINKALESIRLSEKIKINGYNVDAPLFFNKKSVNKTSFDVLVSKLDAASFDGTFERREIFRQIVTLLHENISASDARKILKSFNVIIGRSQKRTIEGYEFSKMLPIINFCFKKIKELEPSAKIDVDKYASIFEMFSKKDKFIYSEKSQAIASTNPVELSEDVKKWDPLQWKNKIKV